MNAHRAMHADEACDPATDILDGLHQTELSLRPATLDVEEPVGAITIRVPDPLACLPGNARRTGGRHHVRRGVTKLTEDAPAAMPDWGVAEVRSVVSAPAVTFHSKSSTFDFFSVKNQRVMFGIGPHEFAHARELEANPIVVEFDLQSIRAIWNVDEREHYTADSVALIADGSIVATEVKASESYFHDPDYMPVMWNARRSFQAAGITFAKVTGDAMEANQRRSWNVARVFHDRGTAFSRLDVDAVRKLLTAEGGSVPLGRVSETLSGNASVGRQMANAMMCVRHLAYDLDAIVTPDTPVSPAPMATTPYDIRRIGL